MSRRRKALVVAGAALLGSSLAFCVSVSGDTREVAGGHSRARPPERARPRAEAPRPDEAPPPAEASPPVEAPPAVRVEPGPLLWPMTPEVVRHVRDIASRADRSDDVFAKVGDSATVSRAFLECFGGDPDPIDLGEHEDLAPTLEHFRGGNAGGIDPFRRDSEAADVGWNARHLLAGDPPPLLREVRAISPRFAFVLNGGNDVEGRDPARFANRMLRIVQHLESRGVVPVLGSVTPREDDPEAERWVRRYNGVTRAIARGRHLPYVDFHQALSALPRRGLAGDRVHPNVLVEDGETRPCDLGPAGLAHGNNVRNLLALQMLDALRRTVVEGAGARARATPGLRGRGSARDPFVVRRLPLTEMRSTEGSGHGDLDVYDCSEHDESGPEHVYRLHLDRPRRVRAWVFSEGDVDVDIHLLRGRAAEDACVARDDAEVVQDLDPGTWFVVVDSFVDDQGTAHAGDYLLVVDVEDEAALERG